MNIGLWTKGYWPTGYWSRGYWPNVKFPLLLVESIIVHYVEHYDLFTSLGLLGHESTNIKGLIDGRVKAFSFSSIDNFSVRNLFEGVTRAVP